MWRKSIKTTMDIYSYLFPEVTRDVVTISIAISATWQLEVQYEPRSATQRLSIPVF